MEALVAVVVATPVLRAVVAPAQLQPNGADAAGVPQLLELRGSSTLWLPLVAVL